MPIEDAHVEVYKDGVLVAEGYTDAEGKFSTPLAPGDYLIRVSKAGFATIEKTETLARSTELIVNLPSYEVLTSFETSIIQPVSDDFDDNIIDPDLWEALSHNGGLVNETNQRLEVTSVSAAPAWNQSGIVSKNNWPFTHRFVEVDVVEHDSVREMLIYIGMEKTTNTDPWENANFYFIAKDASDSTWHVYRRIGGGAQVQVAQGAWAGATGKLRIFLDGATIRFYENGNLRHSEAYQLASATVYVYMYHTSRDLVGTDAFDDFESSLMPPS